MSSQPSAMSKKDEKGKNIQVVVRCRPFNQLERKANSHSVLEFDAQRREVAVRTGGINDKLGKKNYTFDMVFGPAAKQIEVYRSVVCPILDEVIMGYNCTIFAYGQTGTGKTFTMEGERSSEGEFTWEQDPLAGIIPRTLHQIFEKLSENGTEFSVKVSLLEIYNEELFDLLSPSPDVGERLQMFDDPRNKRGVIIKGLEEVTVHNKDEVYHILERGAARRTTASTLMNAYSSRSHSVFSITIHMKETTVDGEELVKIGKLNLVDLAGSENIGRSGAVDKRAREAGNINQSLLTLGRVITSLVERAPHIPYRESKLTRILQDSLGGRTKTSIIATVSPASINLEETVSTLEYANRAKNILNKPEVNQKLTKRALIKEYTEEIERLKRDLAAAREKNGVYLTSENYEELQGKIVCQEEQITDFLDKIAAMEDELKRVTELFSESKKELEECSTILQFKEKELEDTQKNLHESKLRLSQEEFVVSALETTQKKLHNTANKYYWRLFCSIYWGLHDVLLFNCVISPCNFYIFSRQAEHRSTLLKSLTTDLMPVVTSVFDLNSHLSQCLRNFFEVADTVAVHKEEMKQFFTDHSMWLHKLRLDFTSALSSIQSETQSLEEEIKDAQEVYQLISSIQSKLNLFNQGLRNKKEKLHHSVGLLREDLDNVVSEAMEQTSTHHSKFVDCCSKIEDKIRQQAESNISSVEECSRQCEKLTSSINAISLDTEDWCEVTTKKLASATEQQEALFQLAKMQLQSFQKDAGSFCESSKENITGMVNQQRMSEEKDLSRLVEQVNDDKQTVVEQKLELCEQAQDGLRKVQSYLTKELKNDIPTGTTPQRKEYTYPSVLLKMTPREVLLEEHRKKQEEFQAALTSVLSIAEEPVDQDSLEDEPVTVNDSIISEKSTVDVNVLCQENGGVPFFQQKKGLRKEKENKANGSILEKSKISEDVEPSLPRSKLPLRIQN
ncbi:kinesin-like protein KIF11 [Pyxicephalus adspersus]|uniref:kinesin-like protein KIF11 n=2 Tax=Pyxicephalus adspersus TaxID=30357 RepID=UPI003B5B039C